MFALVFPSRTFRKGTLAPGRMWTYGGLQLVRRLAALAIGRPHNRFSRSRLLHLESLTQLLWSGSGITPERNRNGFIFLLARLAPALDEGPAWSSSLFKRSGRRFILTPQSQVRHRADRRVLVYLIEVLTASMKCCTQCVTPRFKVVRPSQ